MGATEEIVRERVREVLAASGVSAAQFAKRVGLDPTKLSKSLAGTRRFTSFELASIADEGKTTIDWLLGGEETKAAVAARHTETVEPAIHFALERAWAYAETDQTLRRLTVFSPVPPLPQPPYDSELAIDAGPRLAERSIAYVRKANRTLRELHEDPAGLIEDVFGINVAFEPLDGGLDGLAFVCGDFRLVMINSKISWSRQRFTLAHECAHILSRDGVDPEGARIDRDIMATGTGARRYAEVRANAFAAAILMPADSIRRRFSKAVTLEGFAEAVGHYLVSPSALAWRLVNLKLLDRSDADPFLTMPASHAAALGGWTDTFGELTVQHSRARRPKALCMRAMQAFETGTISAKPLAAVLNVPLETILSEPCADLAGEEPLFAP